MADDESYNYDEDGGVNENYVPDPGLLQRRNAPSSDEGYVTDPDLLKQLGAPSSDKQLGPPSSDEGYVTDPNLLEQLNAKPEPESPWVTGVRHFVHGLPAMATGAATGALYGSLGGPGGTVGGLLAGAAGAFGESYLQSKATEKFAPEEAERLRAGAEANPVSATIGNVLTAAPFIRPNLGTLALGQRAVGATLTGAMDVGQQLAFNGDVDVKEAALQVAGGALFAGRPTRLGRAIGLPDHPPAPGEQPPPKPLAAPGAVPPEMAAHIPQEGGYPHWGDPRGTNIPMEGGYPHWGDVPQPPPAPAPGPIKPDAIPREGYPFWGDTPPPTDQIPRGGYPAWEEAPPTPHTPQEGYPVWDDSFHGKAGPDAAGGVATPQPRPPGPDGRTPQNYGKQPAPSEQAGVNVGGDPGLAAALRAEARSRAAPAADIETRMREQGVTPRQPDEPLRTATPEQMQAAQQRAYPADQPRQNFGARMEQEFPRAPVQPAPAAPPPPSPAAAGRPRTPPPVTPRPRQPAAAAPAEAVRGPAAAASARKPPAPAATAEPLSIRSISDAIARVADKQGGIGTVHISDLQRALGVPLKDVHAAIARQAHDGNLTLATSSQTAAKLAPERAAAALHIAGEAPFHTVTLTPRGRNAAAVVAPAVPPKAAAAIATSKAAVPPREVFNRAAYKESAAVNAAKASNKARELQERRDYFKKEGFEAKQDGNKWRLFRDGKDVGDYSLTEKAAYDRVSNLMMGDAIKNLATKKPAAAPKEQFGAAWAKNIATKKAAASPYDRMPESQLLHMGGKAAREGTPPPEGLTGKPAEIYQTGWQRVKESMVAEQQVAPPAEPASRTLGPFKVVPVKGTGKWMLTRGADVVSQHKDMSEAYRAMNAAAKAEGIPVTEALRRTGERGRGGRLIKTEPLRIGSEGEILQRGAERVSEPERVVGASVVGADNRVFAADQHWRAANEAGRHYGVEDPIGAGLLKDVGSDGFLTNKGRYVSREEALRIAQAAGQSKPGSAARKGRLETSETRLRLEDREQREAALAAINARQPFQQAIRRQDVVRDPSGRPIKTAPLPIGTEPEILERGAARAAERGLPAREPYMEAAARQPPETPKSAAELEFEAMRGERAGQPPVTPPPKGPAKPPPPPPPPTGAAPPGGQSSKSPHSPAVQAVLDRIATPGSWLDKVPRSVNEAKQALHDLYENTINRTHPINRLKADIERFTQKPLPTEHDFAMLAQNIKGLGGRVEYTIAKGPYEPGTNNSLGPALQPILDKIKGNPDEFTAYAMAKRAVELEGQGRKTGIPLAEANQTVVELGGKWGSTLKDLVDFQVGVLKMARHLIGDEGIAKMMAANKFYIPFYRALDPRSEIGDFIRTGGLAVRDPVKKLVGSERQIVNPLDSALKNTMMFVDLAEKNRARLALKAANDALPADRQFMKQSKRDVPLQILPEQRARMLAEGIPEDMIDRMKFVNAAKFSPDSNKFNVFENGKELIYDIPKDVARVYSGMDGSMIPTWLKIASIPARMLRAGATLTPEFGTRNFFRDQLTAFIQSKEGYVPGYDFAVGLKSVFKKDQAYYDWLREGGARSALVSMDRKLLDIDPKTYADKLQNVVTKPYHLLQMYSELLENATRLGQFRSDVAKGISGLAAAHGSREVTVDFPRMGAANIMRTANMLVPFFNASVQGVDRLARAFRDNPVGTTMKTAGAITLPSVLLWFANKDDARYQELPMWQKMLFWIVPTNDWRNIDSPAAQKAAAGLSDAWKRTLPDGTKQYNAGTLWRIPKPFAEGQIFGSLPERILDAYYKHDPNAFKNVSKSIIDALLPSVIPQAGLPFIEKYGNWSQFLERPLLSEKVAKLPPAQQVYPYTSETAKTIGGVIRAVAGDKSSWGSPIIVDNFLRQWTGGLGKYVTDTIDAGLKLASGKQEPPQPTKTWADVPMVRAFVARFPDSRPESVQNFYDEYNSRKQDKAGLSALKKSDPEAYKQEMQRGAVFDGRAFAKQLAAAYGAVAKIKDDPKLSPDDKRAAIDLTYLSMIETAKKGLAAFERTKRKERTYARGGMVTGYAAGGMVYA